MALERHTPLFRPLLAALTLAAWQVPDPASAQAPDPLDSPKVLVLTTFATYPQSSPDSDAIDLDHPKDGSGRIFLSTNEGKILGFWSSGTPLGVFLDLASPGAVPDFNATLGFVTRGLSYFTFHPDYSTAGSAGEARAWGSRMRWRCTTLCLSRTARSSRCALTARMYGS